MKRLSNYSAMMALMMAGILGAQSGNVVYNEQEAQPIKPVPKGMQLFNIDGVEVYALNRKNAIRKAKQKQHA